MIKTIAIDLDRTICTDMYASGGIAKCTLLPGARTQINKWHKNRHKIIILTHRNGHRDKMATLAWLRRYKIYYDEIHFDKVWFDFFIDDKALSFVSWSELPASIKST